ncbi:sensor histidine kinase [Thermocatellispora tengchongensis]|uniref:sensor histidine kinase n=1 Tax=Thermocatellispora tengchongensis TaxID=1073253 RepID=UPI0036423D0A
MALATTVPIALVRAQPLAAGVLVTAAIGLSLAAFQILTVAGAAAQPIAGYHLGARGSPRAALLLAAPFPVLALARPSPLIVALACLAPAAALAGIAHRARGEARANGAAGRAAADTLLEHAARGERARIARELHDVVAHHISMVAVQAETARLTTPGMPQAGAERLSAIGDTARAALTEMRRLLGVLREDTGGEASPAARRPQPGLRLAELNELLDEARAASGTAVRLILCGAPAELDPGVELAAYRIVQEALTNARRHAPGAAVDVELHYTGEDLRVSIRDNGPGPAARPGPGGHGLAGMRERACAVGGELTTGPPPAGASWSRPTCPPATRRPDERPGPGGPDRRRRRPPDRAHRLRRTAGHPARLRGRRHRRRRRRGGAGLPRAVARRGPHRRARRDHGADLRFYT